VESDAVIHWKYQIAPALRRQWELPNVVYEFASERIIAWEGLTWDDTRHLPGPRAFRQLLRTSVAGSSPATLARAALADAPLLARATAAKIAGTAVRLLSRRPRLLKIRGCAEQYPDPGSRVQLTGERDAYGVQIASLAWRVSAGDVAGVSASQGRLVALIQRSGIGRVRSSFGREAWKPRIGVGFHHMGTTRMSASCRHGVVDRDCRVHGVKNLFVAGSSVFATGGSANPTFTAVSLAVRLARHLENEVSRVGKRTPGRIDMSASRA
jgi:choline dehydrogenase-like flavoprotein